MKKTSLRIVHNQHFFHKAYNIPVCKLNCITGHSQASMLPIHSKMLLERRFEKFKLNIQGNTTPKNTGNFQVYSTCLLKHKFINSLKNTVLYCFNHVKGKCMSIIYQFDCYCITNRLQSDTFCNTKRIHFTECKYGNLQSVNCKSFNGRV